MIVYIVGSRVGRGEVIYVSRGGRRGGRFLFMLNYMLNDCLHCWQQGGEGGSYICIKGRTGRVAFSLLVELYVELYVYIVFCIG